MNIWFIVIAVMVLSFIIQQTLQSRFAKYSQIPTPGRLTGAEVARKMLEGKAVIAMKGDVFAGFCYVECWEHGEFVANSGLIVKKEFRQKGLAKRIKQKALELSMELFPGAKVFGLTTGLAVMKINTAMGYVPVTFSELTTDPVFWKGCENCVNYDVLLRNNFTRCLCTGMLYDPAAHREDKA